MKFKYIQIQCMSFKKLKKFKKLNFLSKHLKFEFNS